MRRHPPRSTARSLLVLCFTFVFANVSMAQSPAASTEDPASDVTVGHQQNGQIETPVNQMLTPFGRILDLPGMRPQALVLSHPVSCWPCPEKRTTSYWLIHCWEKSCKRFLCRGTIKTASLASIAMPKSVTPG